MIRKFLEKVSLKKNGIKEIKGKKRKNGKNGKNRKNWKNWKMEKEEDGGRSVGWIMKKIER